MKRFESILSSFDEVVVTHGDDVALMTNESVTEAVGNITFSELKHMAVDAAQVLASRFGVRAGDNVLVVCHGHAVAEIVACFACIQLGTPFVPIDIKWHTPAKGSKFANIVDDSSPVCAVVVARTDEDDIVSTLRSCGVHRCLFLESSGGVVSHMRVTAPIADFSPSPMPGTASVSSTSASSSAAPAGRTDRTSPPGSDAALDPTDGVPLYLMYTSGSTGHPKGVRGTERGLMHRIKWQAETFPWDLPPTAHGTDPPRDIEAADDRGSSGSGVRARSGEMMCRRTPLTFVDSMAEIFAPLLAGIPLFIPKREVVERGGIVSVALAAAQVGVTRITLLPSQLDLLLRHSFMKSGSVSGQMRDGSCNIGELWPTLKLVVVSGECTQHALVSQFVRVFGRGDAAGSLNMPALINIYGSTEVAGDVSYSILFNPTHRRMLPDMTEIFQRYGIPIGCAIGDNKFHVVSQRPEVSTAACTSTGNSCERLEILNDGSLLDVVSPRDEIGDADARIMHTGELFVEGPHVALGYHHNDAETRKRFVRCRLHRRGSDDKWTVSEPKMLFRTGDLVRVWKPLMVNLGGLVAYCCSLQAVETEGDSPTMLQWVGRVDSQVKIRGVRIELEEVEVRIRGAFRGIRDKHAAAAGKGVATVNSSEHTHSVVAVAVDDTAASRHSTLLVVFAEESLVSSLGMCGSGASGGVSGAAELPSSEAIIGMLRGQSSGSVTGYHTAAFLPDIYIPHLFLTVPAMPVTTTGKVDREQLKQMLRDKISKPQSNLEERENTSPGPVPKRQRVGEKDSRRISSASSSLYTCLCDKLREIYGATLRTSALAAATAAVSAGQSSDAGQLISEDSTFLGLGGDSMLLVELMWRLHHQSHTLSGAVGMSAIGAKGSEGANCLLTHALDKITMQEVTSCTIGEIAERLEVLMSSAIGASSSEGSQVGVEKCDAMASSVEQPLQDINRKTCNAEPNSKSRRSDTVQFEGDLLSSDARVVRVIQRSGCLRSVSRNEPNAAARIELRVLEKFSLLKCVDAAPLYVEYSHSDLCSSHGVVYISSHGGDVTAIRTDGSATTRGSILWRVLLGEHIEGAAAINETGALLFVASFQGTDVHNNGGSSASGVKQGKFRRSLINSVGSLWCIACAERQSALVAADTAPSSSTGDSSERILWRAEVKGEVKGSPVYCRLTGVVYIGCHDHFLYGFQSVTGIMLVRIHAGGSIYATPTVVSACKEDSTDSVVSYIVFGTTAGSVQSHKVVLASSSNWSSTKRLLVDDMQLFHDEEVDDDDDESCGIDAVQQNASDISFARDSVVKLLQSSTQKLFVPSLWLVSKSRQPACGVLNWKCSTGGVFATPTVHSCDKCRAKNGEGCCASSCECECTLVVCTIAHTVLQLRLRDGALVWQTSDGSGAESALCSSSIFSSAAFTEIQPSPGSEERCAKSVPVAIFGCHDGWIRAVDMRDRSLVWTTNVGCAIFSSPFIASVDSQVNSTVAIAATSGGELVVICCCTGAVMGRLRLPGEVFSSPIAVSAHQERQSGDGDAVGINIWIGCRDDHVYCVQMAMM